MRARGLRIYVRYRIAVRSAVMPLRCQTAKTSEWGPNRPRPKLHWPALADAIYNIAVRGEDVPIKLDFTKIIFVLEDVDAATTRRGRRYDVATTTIPRQQRRQRRRSSCGHVIPQVDLTFVCFSLSLAPAH